jgi:hypothetical protein
MGFRRFTGIVAAHDASDVDVADHTDEGGRLRCTAAGQSQTAREAQVTRWVGSRIPGLTSAATHDAAAAPEPSSPLTQMRSFHGRRRFASREEQGGQGSKLLVKALLANQVPILKHLADPG